MIPLICWMAQPLTYQWVVQANMATWSKAELAIAMGTSQDGNRAHELGTHESGNATVVPRFRFFWLLRAETARIPCASMISRVQTRFCGNDHGNCAGLLRTQSRAQHMLRHIESNVDAELDKWTVRHAGGSLHSAYAEVREAMPYWNDVVGWWALLARLKVFPA